MRLKYTMSTSYFLKIVFFSGAWKLLISYIKFKLIEIEPQQGATTLAYIWKIKHGNLVEKSVVTAA